MTHKHNAIDGVIRLIGEDSDIERTPSLQITDRIAASLSTLDIRDVLIRFFTTHGSSWNEKLLLVTFPYWKNLNRADWDFIFEGIKGNQLGEYYIVVLAARYLGVYVEYESTRDVEIASISFPDDSIESGKPDVFVGDSKDIHLRAHKMTFEPYRLKVQDFISVRNRLIIS